jgi:pyruvate dehydrogenase E2 component (dihydrolipoamide acetyltransferase)
MARAVRDVPEMRTRVVAGRIVSTEACEISFAVDIDDGADLAPVKVCDAETKTPAQLCVELTAGAARLRSGTDPAYARSSAIVRRVPRWSVRPLISVASLLTGGLGVPAFGQPGRPLGSAFVSNVGSLGLDEGFVAPLRPVLVLVATADHRLLDGAHAGHVATILRELIAHPDRLDVPATR